MKLEKIEIKKTSFDINLIFYTFLKKITQAKLTHSQILDLLLIYNTHSQQDISTIKLLFEDYTQTKIQRKSKNNIFELFDDLLIYDDFSSLSIFIFAIKLNLIKDLLLQEAKLYQAIKLENLDNLHLLSLSYDKTSTQIAYATRISGALLSLLFFQKLDEESFCTLSTHTDEFMRSLAILSKRLISEGLEPNQIFMLLFSESINQSITSTSGVSYEDRIKSVLLSIGIPYEQIKKTHDLNDSSTEFDFFFEHKNKTYGIGAKRTLRERYKQFIKTAHMSDIDVMIEITLGTDLRENIAKSIREHGVYLFVADEVYQAKPFLQIQQGIYPASDLSLDFLEKLANITVI